MTLSHGKMSIYWHEQHLAVLSAFPLDGIVLQWNRLKVPYIDLDHFFNVASKESRSLGKPSDDAAGGKKVEFISLILLFGQAG